MIDAAKGLHADADAMYQRLLAALETFDKEVVKREVLAAGEEIVLAMVDIVERHGPDDLHSITDRMSVFSAMLKSIGCSDREIDALMDDLGDDAARRVYEAVKGQPGETRRKMASALSLLAAIGDGPASSATMHA